MSRELLCSQILFHRVCHYSPDGDEIFVNVNDIINYLNALEVDITQGCTEGTPEKMDPVKVQLITDTINVIRNRMQGANTWN